MDEAKHLDKEMDVLRDAADKREYEYRNLTVNVVCEKNGDEWAVKGKLILVVNEDPGNEETEKKKSIDALATGKNSPEVMADVFFHLNLLPQQFGDAIFEEGFEDLLDEARKLADGEDVGEAEVLQ